MNVLEKILEEIEHEIMTNKEVGRKQCEGMARAMNIIRSHMNDVTDTNVGSKNNWIPCSERMPEEGDFELIVTDKHGNVHARMVYGYADECEKEMSFYRWDDEYWKCFVCKDAIAWQPLPKPYKGEETAD